MVSSNRSSGLSNSAYDSHRREIINNGGFNDYIASYKTKKEADVAAEDNDSEFVNVVESTDEGLTLVISIDNKSGSGFPRKITVGA